LAESRHHPSLGVTLPLGVNFFYPEELGDTLSGSEVVFIAVSSDAVGDIVRRALPFIKGRLKDIGIIVLSKDFHKGNKKVFLLSETVDRITSRCEKCVHQ
jgi:glycerol-3-phosphate dehydrogenase